MIDPRAAEWDEYFELCKVTPGSNREELAIQRVAKLRQCISGVRNSPIPEAERIEKFLLANQMSTLIELSNGTGIGHDRLKEVLLMFRKKFFVFRADACGNDAVVYSALEKKPTAKTRSRINIANRKTIARWMRFRGFIDAYFFHQPLNMEVDDLLKNLDQMGYPSRSVMFGNQSRLIHFRSVSFCQMNQ
jgi:hypothetical protein